MCQEGIHDLASINRNGVSCSYISISCTENTSVSKDSTQGLVFTASYELQETGYVMEVLTQPYR